MIVLSASRLYTPLREILNPLVFVDDGIIQRVSSRTEQELPNNAMLIDLAANHPESILAPGFIDIHIHGGAGVDVTHSAPNEFPRLNRFLATHGVTAYFPTTVTAPLDQICVALEQLANAIESSESHVEVTGTPAQARPLGIHLEGPFLSHKRRGVHPPENLLAPTVKIFDRFWQAARGRIRMMTIAPELPGALEVIAEAARRKVCVSLGHSDADTPAARNGINAGARHATHTFNAMRPLDHRDPGILGEALTDDRLTADIIADGIHVAPEIVKLFLSAKGPERAVLITDAISATGMPDGAYMLGPLQVQVKDGKCTLDGTLAGSVLTMDRAVRNLRQFSNWTLPEAVRAASYNPARATGLAQPGLNQPVLNQHGEIAVGAEANFALLNPDGAVLKTMVRGRGF